MNKSKTKIITYYNFVWFDLFVHVTKNNLKKKLAFKIPLQVSAPASPASVRHMFIINIRIK